VSKVSILCSDAAHPVNAYLDRWMAEKQTEHEIRLVRTVEDVGSGDFLFLVSCTGIVGQDVRDRFRHTLVPHASDLPEGRGWSPHIWSVLRGDDHLTVSLLVCSDPVDTGDIYRKEQVPLDGTELFDEINDKLFGAELRLMSWALENCDHVVPSPQGGAEATYWPRRTPADGRIDPGMSFSEVFKLLRVSDPLRYPAFYDCGGRRFRVRLEPLDPPS